MEQIHFTVQPETNTIVFINYTPKNIKNTKQKNTF